ncbi:hypothetical protein LOTGIDRAFT_173760 [Lottia gigantea]|uniref:FLYWCH-type domain-containing protein n=1 Tax=Lottia gigantea TaxID=225164 RepID=V4AZU7_LOTGI|nr:hypothetical protein LOTGIDRAFT_173760 [Lottia gigantea]ESO99271.1 hypothetical protein LOTGIDRAFT_173760 [Lottia gigantea]
MGDVNCKPVLIGDFNSRTRCNPDYTIPDNDLIETLDIDVSDDIYTYLYDFENLSKYDVPLNRSSQDTSAPSSYGLKLLEMCKCNNLYIANGRIDQDKNMQFVSTQRGAERLVFDGFDYYYAKLLANGNGSWECVLRRPKNCKARIHATDDHVVWQYMQHNHPPDIAAYVVRRQVKHAALNTPVSLTGEFWRLLRLSLE